MATNPNKLSQFWQELKRRNVVRVITVYAGAAFVIIELINNITEPLQLPGWTPTLVIVLLAIGFPIVIIFSWIYDLHPEGGMVKTEPGEKIKEEDIPNSSNGWKVASYISFVVIVGLIVLNIIPRSGEKEFLDKSIAVLPFINDSPEEEGMYFINGSMESILDNLSRIQDLRVVSRTSVEQYRNNLKPVREIAQEMEVAYILEGSGLKHGDQIRLTLQLIDAVHDTHIWSDSYERKADEVFELYNDVAQMVASEIEAVITPAEQERIDKIPTSSTTAFDLYQKAIEVDGEESIALLQYALDYDSTFVLPYVLLGMTYLDMYTKFTNLYPTYLDSVARMAEMAFHFDPQSAEAHSLQGYLHNELGETRNALLSFDRALELNPNLADAYNGIGWIYFGEMDYVNALDNFYQNILRNRTPANLGQNFDNIGFVLMNVGLREKAIQSYKRSLQYTGDSIWYFIRRSQLEFYTGNYLAAINIAHKEYEDVLLQGRTENIRHYYGAAILGESSMFADRNQEAYRYFKRYVEGADSIGWPIPFHKMEIAFVFGKNGDDERASELIELQIKQSEEWISENHQFKSDHYQHLAEANSLVQNKDSALKYLRLLSQEERMSAIHALIPENPIFKGMKDDPEFIEICDQIKAKYLSEQESIRQWLAENEML